MLAVASFKETGLQSGLNLNAVIDGTFEERADVGPACDGAVSVELPQG